MSDEKRFTVNRATAKEKLRDEHAIFTNSKMHIKVCPYASQDIGRYQLINYDTHCLPCLSTQFFHSLQSTSQMTQPISRFFAPRIAVTSRSNQENGSNKSKEHQVKLQKDGWQIPIGLTANDAIEIDDSDDENQEEQIEQLDLRVPRNDEAAIVLPQNDPSPLNPTERIKPPAPTPEQNERSASAATSNNTESTALHGHNYVQDTSPKSTNVHAHTDGVINLCSPDTELATVKKNPSMIQSASQTEKTPNSIKSSDNVLTINSSNPFLEFANNLGSCESSYFTKYVGFKPPPGPDSTILPGQNLSRQGSESRKETPAPRSSRATSEPTTCQKPSERRKRKRTFAKTDDDVEFSKKTPEELEACRQKWQSFADVDAPLEIRRFQVLIAARIHCQAHDQIARRVMDGLRDHFRISKSNDNVSSLPKQDQGDQIKEEPSPVPHPKNCDQEEDNYLSPNTLRKANPEVISKLLSSVLFANVKAKHIIQAAKEIKFQFGGKVPESNASLKSIIGIGPKLAELLHHVNSYDAYRLVTKKVEE